MKLTSCNQRLSCWRLCKSCSYCVFGVDVTGAIKQLNSSN